MAVILSQCSVPVVTMLVPHAEVRGGPSLEMYLGPQTLL